MGGKSVTEVAGWCERWAEKASLGTSGVFVRGGDDILKNSRGWTTPGDCGEACRDCFIPVLSITGANPAERLDRVLFFWN
jgi:hypothetical protein